jgi:trans-aconitate 2-methyltransferase
VREDWNGSRYDLVADPQAHWGKVVLGRLDLSGDEIVLDAGCGSGRVTEELLGRVPEGQVIALDASVSMLARARARLSRFEGRVKFVHADLLDLEPRLLGAPCAAVDAVLSTATFHWVTDHDRLFANLAGVLRPGGQLVAQCGGRGNLDAVIAAVRSLGVERAGTWLYATPDETSKRLEAAGFVDVKVWLNAAPTPFENRGQLVDFLETVCLREHVATLREEERRPFVELVVSRMPEPVVDYVRLNIVAKLDPTGMAKPGPVDSQRIAGSGLDSRRS